MCKKFIAKPSSPLKKVFWSSERGFVITVDAFLSVVVMILLILASFFYLSKVSSNSWNVVDLRNIVSDKAVVLEKNHIFEDSILRDSSELLEASLNLVPEPYCLEATVLNASLSPVVHAVKVGCTSTPTQIISSERTIILRSDAGSSFFIAKVEGWVK